MIFLLLIHRVGQILGSVCLPLHQINLGFDLNNENFASRYGFLKPDSTKSQNIVLTCRSGRRVLIADKILKDKGYLNLRIYSGSFRDWVKNNGPIIKDNIKEFDYFWEIWMPYFKYNKKLVFSNSQ